MIRFFVTMFSLLCFTITSQAQTKTETICFDDSYHGTERVEKVRQSDVVLLFKIGTNQYSLPTFYEKTKRTRHLCASMVVIF